MDFAEYIRFFMALGFVLLLITVLAALVRRSGLGDRLAVTKGGSDRRLALVEVRPLDAKRKLVLLRRDDREHLVLLGSGSDLLIETNIPAAAVRNDESTAAEPTAPAAGGTIVERVLTKLRATPS
ncbi:FliO/MopB family protein [Pelagibius litoralis]|uniref:FliO/MopB family protein n=1 Tax=Pelagibius litoralis TaxID=374515 RepID=A0A967EXZ7_9PROT|nr:flagellar biosynthetic protein FliO [Pelagibius litoralis]NIA69440.1 FliO/MopB family protein [Pelagibius litoralis]